MAEIDQVEAPKGLDAILDANIEAHFAEAEKVVEAPEKSEATDKPEVKIDATGRVHGADGKFASKEPAEAAAPDPGLAKADAKTAPIVAADPAQAQLVEPHPRWPAELKAEFAKWPPEVQKSFRARDDATEAEYTRKSQEVAETRKSHEPLLGEIQRQTPFLQQIGYTPEKFLAESAAVAQRLMSGSPEHQGQALAYLAQLHRVPPEAVLRAMGVSITQDGMAQAPPPELQQLRQQVFATQQTLEQFQQQQTQQERMRAQAEFEAIGQTKDESGQLKYPHFGRVKQTMVKLVANDLATTWDQAYKVAVRGDDELYQQTVAAERQSEAAKAEADRKAAVEKAQNARPVKTSSSAPGGGTQRKGLDAHLEAAIERAGIG